MEITKLHGRESDEPVDLFRLDLTAEEAQYLLHRVRAEEGTPPGGATVGQQMRIDLDELEQKLEE